MNIGAGRIVYQELTRINKSIREGEFYENEKLLNAIHTAKQNNVALHLFGLVSKGGVHSNQEHIYAICELAKQEGLENVFIHAFTDGRDCDPKSGLAFVQELESELVKTTGKIASVIGRYYAMDRDNRLERVAKAYHAMVNAQGNQFNSVT